MRYIFWFISMLGFCAHATEIEGTYLGQGHYGQVVISKRGSDSYLLKTCGSYLNGQACLDIQAVLTPKTSTDFSTQNGSITAVYGGSVCSYPILLELSFDGTKLYLSEFGPGSFPQSFAGCPNSGQLGYSNYVDTHVYTKVR